MSADFGEQFSLETDDVEQAWKARDSLIERCVPFGNDFLNDALGGIYGDDIVVYGADVGCGKTELIVGDVQAAAKAGADPCYAFMLEAADKELYFRLFYQELARRGDLKSDYADFWRGRLREVERKHKAEAEAAVKKRLKGVWTYYKKKGDFTNWTLERQLKAIRETAQFVALDHLHVIDNTTSGRELETQKRTVDLLRELSLAKGVPVVTASHLRKPQPGQQRLVPRKEDLLGSKLIAGVATVIVMVARDYEGGVPASHLSPTFFLIDKDRRGRSSNLVARLLFNKRTGQYEPGYELGRIVWEERKQMWKRIEDKYRPHWAKGVTAPRPLL